MQIMEGKTLKIELNSGNLKKRNFFAARRKAAAKREKMKNLGKSKSTDTEVDTDDESGKQMQLAKPPVFLSHSFSPNKVKASGSCAGFWRTEKRIRFGIRHAVKTQAFYWFVIVLVFLNSTCAAIGHYDQPQFLEDFICKWRRFPECKLPHPNAHCNSLIRVYQKQSTQS